MKLNTILILFGFLILGSACRKDDTWYVDPSNPLEFSDDSVSFDTVFTSIGSTTRRIKIFNRSKEDVRVAEIKLMGGLQSPYQININGISTHQLTNFKIRGQDSIQLFIKVTIDPNAENQPFIITDSIHFITDGKLQKLHLRAFGQNARFLKDALISENTNWDNDRPYVIYNYVKVSEGKTLTIAKGSRVYFHKGSKMEVAGSLRIEGEATDSVTFASDRLERIPYAEEKGQWEGIRLLKSSKDNFINHATIKNALIGIQVDSLSNNGSPKLFLVNSIIKNMEIAAIAGYNTFIKGYNNLISNCDKYLVYCPRGGDYYFKQNTFVNTVSRSTPSLFFSDFVSQGKTNTLQVTLINNIIWGALQDELIVEKKGNQFSQFIRSNLVKSRDRNLEGIGNMVNLNPLFVPNSTTYYLLGGSPAENSGENLSSDLDFAAWLMYDQRKKERIFPSELGCYEIF